VTEDQRDLLAKAHKSILAAEMLLANGFPSFAASYAVDYLATWNFTHLANVVVRQRLRLLNSREGLPTPMICTPEELMGE
jgi:hypothetical protein